MKKYISTVSRNIDPRQTGYESVVFQTGKSVLDSELNLSRDLSESEYQPSGVISKKKDIFDDYTYGHNPNILGITAFDVRVANRLIRVSDVLGENLIELPDPPASGKRTDFVFLEVWRALVHPSVAATAKIRVLGTIAGGDTITFDNGVDPATTFICGPDFALGASTYITALNLANAITTSGLADADSRGTDFVFITFPVGASSNSFVISASASISIIQQPTGGSDGNGKPSADKIYLYGNTQSNSSGWLDDDTLDPLVNRETTKRVQFQYRFRVIEGIDYTVNPDGFSSIIFGQGGAGSVSSTYLYLPATLSNPNYPYLDSGLWVAGDGDQTSATDLNTVDGFSYAIPICFVNRRNTGGFVPLTNVNGALLSTHTGATSLYIYPPALTVIGAGVSDRPDGLFADKIVKGDTLDLRKKVVGHVDLHKELEYQFQSLLDHNYKTWQIDGSDLYEIGGGSGDVSHTPLVCDQIGTTASPYGNEIGKYDHIRRRFSAHPTIERLVIELYPDTVSTDFITITPGLVGRNNWYLNDEIVIDLTKLDVTRVLSDFIETGGSPVYFTDVCPIGTCIIDVIEAWHDEGHTTIPKDTFVVFKKISGLGTTQVTFKLGGNSIPVNGGDSSNPDYYFVGLGGADIGSPRRIFISLAVSYPEGSGLTATPSVYDFVESPAPYEQGSIVEKDTSNRPTDSYSLLDNTLLYALRDGYREWLNEYVGSKITDTFVSLSANEIRVPYKAYGVIPTLLSETNPNKVYRSYLDSTFNPKYEEVSTPGLTNVSIASEFGSSSGILVPSSPLSNAQILVNVEYYPLNALNTQNVVMLYYRTLGPQTAGSKAGSVVDIVPNPLELEPLVASNNMYAIQLGKGANEVSYPYYSPSDVIPTTSSLNLKEWELKATGNISTGDFNINTGLLRIGALTPVDISSDLTFSGVDKDADSRVLYSNIDLVATYTTPLASATVHKTVLPLLCKVKNGSVLFREGEVVMVVYSRLSEVDSSNYIAPNDRTVVSVYATKNRIIIGE